MDSALFEHWRREITEIAARADREGRDLTTAERVKVTEILDKLHTLKQDRELIKAIDGDADPDRIAGDTGGDLHTAILASGYEQKTHPVAAVPVSAALGMRAKAGSYSGDFATDPGVADLEPSPELGRDERFLYPRLRVVPIEPDITSIQSYRQSTRTLANAALMVRDIDDVTEKPSTNTVSELLSVPVSQIATISKGVPNVLLANTGFRGWVGADLSLAYRNAVDTHVVGEITTSVTTVYSGSPANVYEETLFAAAAVRGEGYTPSLIVVSPADALAIELLQLAGGVSYAFSQSAPTMIVTPSVADGAGFVLDPQAAGTLYLSPAAFQTFEENSGQTNSSTARFESHGAFVVQRPAAIALLGGGS